jgi:anti-sigma28 factor (negative regulator of flagellin synthesis)
MHKNDFDYNPLKNRAHVPTQDDRGKQGEKMKRTNQGREAAHPILPVEIYSHSQIAALAKRKAELRAQKVQRIKKQIEEGTYDVSAADVVRGLARSESSWLLNLADVCLPGVR